jgi:hypothetical protein
MNENIKESGAVARGRGSRSKEWITPALRKLPIAATSGGGVFNEGVGKGKGESGPIQVS